MADPRVNITITIETPSTPVQAHPCYLGLHRWAWLTDGRQACGICGRPR